MSSGSTVETRSTGGGSSSEHSTESAKRNADPLVEEALLSGSLESANQFVAPSGATRKAGSTILSKLRFGREEDEEEGNGEPRLFGRDAETKILLDALERCKTAEGTRELVSIGGLSGTGKSALARCLRVPVRSAKGIFASGKCVRGQAYSEVSSACRDLCRQLLERSDVAEIRTQIAEAMSRESVALLTGLVPELARLSGLQPLDEEADDDRSATVEQTRHRFRYAFCRFLECVTACLKGNPLVVALEDVHAMEEASVGLLHALMEDRDNPHSLMIVTTYRTNELEDQEGHHPYVDLLTQVRSMPKVTVTGVQLGNLGKEQVDQMLRAVLSVDDASDLAELCLQRTLGNAFFLQRFLVMLEEEQLLRFNDGQSDWRWDCQQIEASTAVTANVVDLLTVKMTSLPPGLQRLLSLASFLGPSFEWNTICIIWNALPQPEEPTASNSIEEWLNLALQEHFLEKDGSSRYRWSHDMVQEAASSLVPSEDAASMRFQLGEILYQSYSRQQLMDAIFLVSNLMNAVEVSSLTPEQQTRNAQLNLKAATKAKDMSAFESASSYIGKGLETIHNGQTEPEQWPQDDSFRLLLDLHSVGAQTELAMGRSDEAAIHCDKILKQEKATILDKRRAYTVVLQSMGAGGKPAEAVHLAFRVLKDLGCKFPTNSTLQTVSGGSAFMKATSKRNVPTKETIENLPLMTDPAKMECMKIMDMASAWAYATGQSFVFLLFLGRMVEWSLKYGLSDRSPAAFANLGFLAGNVKGSKELGVAWGEHSMLALSRVESKICESRCYMARAWQSPYSSTLQPLLQGYKSGMMAGDVINAMLCLWHVIHHALLSGTILRKVEEDCRRYSSQMATLKQKQVAVTTCMTWQAILNLMGVNKKRTILLQGEAFDEEDFLSRRVEEDEEVVWNMDHFQAIKSILYCYFGEHEAGAELSIKKGDSYQKKNPGGPIGSVDCFCRAVSLHDCARRNKGKKRRLYSRHAAAARKTLANIARNGSPNVAHLVKLLYAEHLALDAKKRRQTIKCYESSISMAARGGFVQDAALASERLAEYLLLQSGTSKSEHAEGDKEEARFRLEKAVEYYEEWGAFGKAELLQLKMDELVEELPPKRATECWR